MNEAMPVVLGVLIGAVVGRRASSWSGAVLAAGAGMLVSAAAGDLAVSWSYALSAAILRRLRDRLIALR